MNPIADNDFEEILHSFRSEESTPAPVLPPECRDLQRMVRRTLEELITGNKTLLEQCAEILLERQELTGEEFRQMLVSRAEQPVQ